MPDQDPVIVGGRPLRIRSESWTYDHAGLDGARVTMTLVREDGAQAEAQANLDMLYAAGDLVDVQRQLREDLRAEARHQLEQMPARSRPVHVYDGVALTFNGEAVHAMTYDAEQYPRYWVADFEHGGLVVREDPVPDQNWTPEGVYRGYNEGGVLPPAPVGARLEEYRVPTFEQTVRAAQAALRAFGQAARDTGEQMGEALRRANWNCLPYGWTGEDVAASEQLLHSLIGDRRYGIWQRRRRVWVQSHQHPNLAYDIRPGERIQLWSRVGRKRWRKQWRSLCIHTEQPHPPADEVATLVVLAEQDERRLWEVANPFPRPAGWAIEERIHGWQRAAANRLIGERVDEDFVTFPEPAGYVT